MLVLKRNKKDKHFILRNRSIRQIPIFPKDIDEKLERCYNKSNQGVIYISIQGVFYYDRYKENPYIS